MNRLDSTRAGLKHIGDFVSPVNAAFFFAVTVFDLLTPALRSNGPKLQAACAAAALVTLVLGLNSAYQEKLRSGDSRSTLACFLSSRRRLLACLAALACLLFAGVSWARQDGKERGTLATAFPPLTALQDAVLRLDERTQRTQRTAEDILQDTQAIRQAVVPTDPRARLKTLGLGLDAESKARAIEGCDLDALALYAELREPLPLSAPALGQRGGSVLERPILERNPRLPEVLRLLAQQGLSFDQPYALTFTQAQTARIPDFDWLAGRLRHPQQRLGFQPALVQANALALALWFDNEAAVRTLRELGARTDTGVEALLPEIRGGMVTGLKPQAIASAQDIAHRRGHEDWLR